MAEQHWRRCPHCRKNHVLSFINDDERTVVRTRFMLEDEATGGTLTGFWVIHVYPHMIVPTFDVFRNGRYDDLDEAEQLARLVLRAVAKAREMNAEPSELKLATDD